MLDTNLHHNRILEYGYCPICNTLKACLTQTDLLGKRKEVKPKKRQTQKFLEDCLKQKYFEYLRPIKHGSRQNMFWFYQINGLIKDFNDEKKGKCYSDIVYIT